MPRQRPFRDLRPGVSKALAHRPREDERDQGGEKPDVAVSLRIRTEDEERVVARARELGLSRDALTRGLVQAALDALDGGLLRFYTEIVVTSTTDKRGRKRAVERQFARPAWTQGEGLGRGGAGDQPAQIPRDTTVAMDNLFGGPSKVYPEPGAGMSQPEDDTSERKARR
jgi:hypothetical protein